MDDPDVAKPSKQRRFVVTGFGLGLVFGSVGVTAAYNLLIVSLGANVNPNFRANIVGEHVSAHGGAKIVITNEYGRFAQECNDVCDGVSYTEMSPDNSFQLKVVDALGRCVLCDDPGAYVTNGVLTEWKVSGRDKLLVTRGDRFGHEPE